jgi:hypothetical protein
MSSRTSVPYPAEVPGTAVGEGAGSTASFSGTATGSGGGGTLANFVAHTGYTPGVASGAFVKARILVVDTTNHISAASEWNVALATDGSGNLSVQGSAAQVGANFGSATGSLVSDLGATGSNIFTIDSSTQTLLVTVTVGGYTGSVKATVKIST